MSHLPCGLARAVLPALLALHAGSAESQPLPEPRQPPEPRSAEPANPAGSTNVDDRTPSGESVEDEDGGRRRAEEREGGEARTEGGPPPSGAPGLFDVDEEAAVRALERSLIQADALLLSPGHVELGFGLGFGADLRSEPVLLQSAEDDGLFGGSVDTRLESLGAEVELQVGLPFRSQFGVVVPFNSNRLVSVTQVSGAVAAERDETSTDFGDVRVSFLKTLFEERGGRPDLIALVAYDADTANRYDPPVGSGAAETTVGLNATKRQDPLVFTLGLSHTVSGSDRDFRSGAVTLLSFGTFLAASPYTSLQIGFTQRHIDNAEFDDDEIPGTGSLGASLQLGASSVVSRSVFLSADLSVGLTDVEADYRFSLRISRRFAIGG